MQKLQVAHENALELGSIAAATGLAAVVNDAVVVREFSNGGFGDLRGEGEVSVVGGGSIELNETAENDALVVGPCLLGGC